MSTEGARAVAIFCVDVPRLLAMIPPEGTSLGAVDIGEHTMRAINLLVALGLVGVDMDSAWVWRIGLH